MWFAPLEPREFGSTFSLIVALLNNENESKTIDLLYDAVCISITEMND